MLIINKGLILWYQWYYKCVGISGYMENIQIYSIMSMLDY